MSIRLSNLPLASDSVVSTSFLPVADLTDLPATTGLGRTLNIPTSGIYNMSAYEKTLNITESYIVSKNDYKSNILCNNSLDIDIITVLNSQENITPGFRLNIIRNNFGNVHIVPSGSVYVHSDLGFYLKNQYSLATLTKITYDHWILTGDLSEIPTQAGSPTIPAYIVSGSNDILYNGNYYLDPDLTNSYGTPNSGTKVYKNENNSIFIYFGDGGPGAHWWIGPVVGRLYADSNGYYLQKDSSEPLPSTGWDMYPIDRGTIFVATTF